MGSTVLLRKLSKTGYTGNYRLNCKNGSKSQIPGFSIGCHLKKSTYSTVNVSEI